MSLVTSWRFPLVRETASGVPFLSTMRWCLLPGALGRPAKVRCEPPFEGPDVRGIGRRVVHLQQSVSTKFRQQDVLQAGPHSGLGPVPQTTPGRHPTAPDELRGYLPPAHTLAKHVNDAPQSSTVIGRQPPRVAVPTRRTNRQQRSNTFPQDIRHTISRHPTDPADTTAQGHSWTTIPPGPVPRGGRVSRDCASIGSTGGLRATRGSLRGGQEAGPESVRSLRAAPEHPAGKGGKRCPFTSVLQWRPAPQSHS